MKKVYLKCVYKKNLGDDLLIKSICDRYPDVQFYTLNYLSGRIKPTIKNLRTLKVPFSIYRLFRKISYLTNTTHFLENFLIKRSDFVVSIAGSIFVEKKDTTLDERYYWFKNLNSKFYLIGSNIGPIYTRNYVEIIKKDILKKAQDVSLRDKKSFSLVNDLNNVRYAPDIVFSLNIDNYLKTKEEKKVIISVIDINDKANQIVTPNSEKYIKLINDLIDFFVKVNYKIELFSFCNSEKDDRAIKKILSTNKHKNDIFTFYYDGNVDCALNEIASAKVVIGTRFHANILGLILFKTVIPIIYNDKTRELLNDINFKGKTIDIERIDEFDINTLKENDLNYKIDISKQTKDAERHFEKLDIILKKNNN